MSFRHRANEIDSNTGIRQIVNRGRDRLLILPVSFAKVRENVQMLHGPLLF